MSLYVRKFVEPNLEVFYKSKVFLHDYTAY